MSEALMKAYVVGDQARPGQSKQLPQSAWHEDYVNGQAVEPPYDLEALAVDAEAVIRCLGGPPDFDRILVANFLVGLGVALDVRNVPAQRLK